MIGDCVSAGLESGSGSNHRQWRQRVPTGCSVFALMPPWNRCRKKYRRRIERSWGFIVDDTPDPPYRSCPWRFLEVSLEI